MACHQALGVAREVVGFEEPKDSARALKTVLDTQDGAPTEAIFGLTGVMLCVSVCFCLECVNSSSDDMSGGFRSCRESKC